LGQHASWTGKQFWRNCCEETAIKLKLKSYEYDEEESDRREIGTEESKRKVNRCWRKDWEEKVNIKKFKLCEDEGEERERERERERRERGER
jgi:hypothetical protein